jgi:phthiocerol/phenolphthiocerol synthesis type-I polyketide synthase E
VGLHDNFFDLGGHSLAAVSMLLEVKKVTGRTLPLATLFQAPTIATLGELLRKDGWSPLWSSLVPIRSQGTKTPLFLVHGAEGNVLLYRHLAQHLDVNRPIYGLQSHGLDGKSALDQTIREMASRYIKEVVTLQPKGPYLLGGYCLGGTIALEMAQQLMAMREKVELVILLETYNPGLVSRKMALALSPLHKLQNLWFHTANLASLIGNDRRRFLVEKLDTERTRLHIRLQTLSWLFSGAEQQDADARYPHLRIKRTNDRANFNYMPQPYHGRVAVIRPRGHFAGEADPSFGWSKCIKALEIHELSVHPRGMLAEPFCRVLATTMNKCLDEE